jgi:aquaporin Z
MSYITRAPEVVRPSRPEGDRLLSDPSATRSTVPSRRPADPGFHWLIWMAEAGGTGLLVLGALSAAALNLAPGSPIAEPIPSASLRLLITGLMVGAIVTAIAVSPLGKLSGAHINPAVTAAFAVSGQMAAHDVIGYLVAQVTGALAGALAFRALWGSTAHSVGGGVTHPSISTPLALGFEAGMTALLVAVIFFFLSRERLASWTPIVICPVLALIILEGRSVHGREPEPGEERRPSGDIWRSQRSLALLRGARRRRARCRRALARVPPRRATNDGEVVPRPALPLLARQRASCHAPGRLGKAPRVRLARVADAERNESATRQT